MNPVLIAQLLATFGPPAITLIDGLIKKIETKGDVTSAEWDTLSEEVRQTGKDRMLLVLKTAGIDPTSAQGIALLSAAS